MKITPWGHDGVLQTVPRRLPLCGIFGCVLLAGCFLSGVSFGSRRDGIPTMSAACCTLQFKGPLVFEVLFVSRGDGVWTSRTVQHSPWILTGSSFDVDFSAFR
jgi:hypothetical protein